MEPSEVQECGMRMDGNCGAGGVPPGGGPALVVHAAGRDTGGSGALSTERSVPFNVLDRRITPSPVRP